MITKKKIINYSLLFFIALFLSGCSLFFYQDGLLRPCLKDMAFIPAGTFPMGNKAGDSDEKPVHAVYLDGFFMDKYEVTNGQYQKFLQRTHTSVPRYWGQDELKSGPEFGNYPVMGVSWYEAQAYCQWCGKRLPTEAEWECAAAGRIQGKETRDNNTYEATSFNKDSDLLLPVGSKPPNTFGIYDMLSSVLEWCSDWYDSDYYRVSPSKNPKGPLTGAFRVVRGHHTPSDRFSYPAQYRRYFLGFRCACSSP